MRELEGEEQQAPWEGVSDAAKREGLYEEHEIKGELVIGPDVLQPPDIAFALRASKPKLKPGGRSNAETPIAMCANSECLQENSRNPVSTDTCGNQLVDKEQHSTKTIQEEINPRMEICNKENSHTSEKPKYEVGSSQSSQNQYSTRPKRTCLEKKHFACAKKFSEKNDLITYNVKNHLGQPSFRCDICKKQFVSSKNLWNHKQMHAGGDTPYSCDMCAKQFSHKSYLNVHKRIHVTNKPHPCDVCGEQFLSKYQLNTHKQSHVIEKPYTCKNCNKQFAQNKYFIKHIWNCKK